MTRTGSHARELAARSREAFWLIPGLMVAGSIVLAQAALAVDRWVEGSTGVVPDTLLLGVDGSRAMLGAVGGAVLAVAGTTFSITISVIATASSTYGPRLVRNFMTDRRNQATLGIFVGTFTYCMIVLRSVTSQDESLGTEAFVPYFSVYGSLLLALVNVAALVYFLHHIAESIQISHLVARVRRECESVVNRYYGPPSERAQGHCQVDLDHLPAPRSLVLARDSGSVTLLDEGALVGLAARHDVVIRMLAAPGTHLLPGEPVAEIRGNSSELVSEGVLSALSRGATRTPAQDVLFAIQQLTEIAVRALSPGTNDPYTARNVLAEIARPLQVVTEHPTPLTGRCDGDGDLRVALCLPDGQTVVDEVFDDIRAHAAGQPHVVRAVVDLAARLSRTAPPHLHQRLRTHADLAVASWAVAVPAFDERRMRDHLTQAFASVGEGEQISRA